MHVRIAPNKRIEYYNMCNTATLRTCLSGSGAFPLLKAVGNGEGGLGSPLDFGRSVNPVPTRGTDYSHLITTHPPSSPGFSNLPTALLLDMGYHLYFRP